MIDLSTLELERLKLLLSELYPQKSPAASPRRILTTEEKISTLDILRSKFPDLFSDLPEEKLKDNNFLVKYLADPYKRNKIRNAVLRRLSSAQQLELSQALGEETVATEVYKQPAAGEIPTEQASPTEATTGASAGGMPAGLPSMPSAPSITFTKPPVVIHDVPHASGMEGGAGTGISATSKIDRLEAERVGPATAKGNRLTANATAKPDSLPESASRIKPVQQKPVQQVFQTPSGLNFSAFKSSFSSGFKKVQNLASAANPFIKINSSRIIRGLGGMVKGIGNGIVHTGLPGVYNAGARAGMGVLNSGGSIANLGRFGGGGSSSIFGKMGRFGKGRGGGVSSLGKVGKSRGKWALLGLLAFLGVGILGFTGANQPGTTTGGGIPTGSSDISQCKFTRGDHNPKETSFKSNLLLSYIQEAAQKANIPPVVLAAFIRVESPSTSGMSDDQITNYAANCAESPTKALGIMQIQPPGTTSARGDPASCDDCIDAGAKLVGKTVSTMTTADYCDPRTSIIVGGGWILKKMNKLGLGDGTKWDTAWTNDRKAIETLVRTYYGDILYPNSNTGPFNYADDVWTSIQIRPKNQKPFLTHNCKLPFSNNLALK
ncbi:hypothetical protein HYU95_01425 [Candidatus Daviesbacteria bacterium]|nr:hypothetical protein [Candidatus Daviesbacteria bacterium]